jgi:hypothetical protein
MNSHGYLHQNEVGYDGKTFCLLDYHLPGTAFDIVTECSWSTPVGRDPTTGRGGLVMESSCSQSRAAIRMPRPGRAASSHLQASQLGSTGPCEVAPVALCPDACA